MKLEKFLRKQKLEMLNEAYDVESVKENLPDVKIRFDGEVYDGYIRSNETEYAYVRIYDFPGTKFKFSWETIVDSLNNKSVLDSE